MDSQKIRQYVDQCWDDSILPALHEYIRIPNESPVFDPQWKEHGHMDRAVALIREWIESRDVKGMKVEVCELEGRTPLILVDIPGQGDDTVLLYGHLDKQPPFEGWVDGLGPWTPVMRDGKLYGRGGADDGYAAFASLTAIEALQRQGIPHARCVLIVEACEESGSFDLPYHIEALGDRLGSPSLVVCLDSGCGDYDRMWVTNSLRGLVSGDLVVSILREGIHSGDASGVVPSSFRIIRQILSRLEDEATGKVLLDALHVEIPQERLSQAEATAEVLGPQYIGKYPFVDGARTVEGSIADLLLARTWRPALSVTGAAGMPPLENAGNVLRPATSLKLSMRLPPHVDNVAATRAVKELLEKDPPYGAHVHFEPEQGADGWNAPALEPWLEKSAREASAAFFGRDACYMGEGGSIPFMAMLGEKFPKAQFLVTGVLGPESNAHGPNEFLHVQCGKNLTACVSHILAEHHQR